MGTVGPMSTYTYNKKFQSIAHSSGTQIKNYRHGEYDHHFILTCNKLHFLKCPLGESKPEMKETVARFDVNHVDLRTRRWTNGSTTL